eukprot:TRINITY_DN2399_c0_g3_i7.p1 TRINITY_DN2399_c0_g3~~TRINITY_DN2399_c0_g3_i7.p1  ORF type:complete len:801 (-),score=132.93 TRINITY_DN2399_c0_g3_i7:801-3203(-)
MAALSISRSNGFIKEFQTSTNLEFGKHDGPLLFKKLPSVRSVATPDRISTSRPSGTTEGPYPETKRSSLVSTRSADVNSRSRKGRMVPIDVALSQIRNKRENGERALDQNLTAQSAVEVKNGNGATTSSFPMPSRDGNGAVSVQTEVPALKRVNGFARSNLPTRANGYTGTANGYSNGYAGQLGDSKANGAATSLVLADRTSPVSSQKKLTVKKLLLNSSEDLKILPSDESFKWAQEKYNTTQRSIDVWSFVASLRVRLFLVDTKWTYLEGFSEEKQKARRRSMAAWVRESILELGPTFIKLGQLSSSRSDLLPAEFVEELAKLQDRVPAFGPDKVLRLVESELGAPVSELFAEFELRPIAAASLGQVHRAVLPNGELVVVKVQRPGLKELFDIDLGNMKLIAGYFQKSESLGGPTRDWLGIYEECATILYQEIDYINEGRNADRFRSDFRKYPWVKVPKVYWDFTGRRVITLEYAPGIKISEVERLNAAGLDRQLIAQRAIEGYLIQILKTGFFHADPHPGNLAVDVDNSLIYYDFGMMGEIQSFTKERLEKMFYAVYEKDAGKVINSLMDLGALVPTGDISSVRRSIQYFLDNLTGPQADQKTTVSAIGEDLFAIAVDQPFRFPATFTFVLRAFSTLEGVGKTLDPDYSFPKIAAPYAQELLDIRDSQSGGQEYVVQRLQKQAGEVRDATISIPTRVQRIDDIVKRLEAGDLKLRVRVLESERAARRAGILQTATLNAIAAGSLLNVGVQLLLSTPQQIDGSMTAPATTAFAGAGVFILFIVFALRRVQRLDKFEKML